MFSKAQGRFYKNVQKNFFDRIEDKLKRYAIDNIIGGLVLCAIILGVNGVRWVMADEATVAEVFTLWFIAFAVLIVTQVVSLLLYAFAELLESTKRTETNVSSMLESTKRTEANVSSIVDVLKIVYAKEISEAAIKKEKAEVQKAEQERREAAKRQNEAQKQKEAAAKSPEELRAIREEAIERQVRDKSPEELKALKDEIMVTLIELGMNGDGKEKERLLNLLSAIDEELQEK